MKLIWRALWIKSPIKSKKKKQYFDSDTINNIPYKSTFDKFTDKQKNKKPNRNNKIKSQWYITYLGN